MPDFRTRIAGIPAIVRYTICGAYEAPSEFCPGDQPGVDTVEVCDRRGRSAPWLADKMTAYEDEMLVRECWRHYQNERAEQAKSAAESAVMWRQDNHEMRYGA